VKDGQQWMNRIYTTDGSADKEQQQTPAPGKQPGHVVSKVAAGTAAPQQQNRLSVDSWYYSLAEGSPNIAAGSAMVHYYLRALYILCRLKLRLLVKYSRLYCLHLSKREAVMILGHFT
jgi:hypothetical protein